MIRACHHFQLNGTLLCGVDSCVDAHADRHRVYHAWSRAPGSGPGLAGRTIQCPGCGRHFKTHHAVRQHQDRMAKSSKCYKDLRPPIPSGWASGCARAAGRAENLSRGGRLSGMTDSDTDSNGARSPRRMDRDEQPAQAASPADSDANPRQADPVDHPADPADDMQVKILSYIIIYILSHINADTSIYIEIHIIYIHIHHTHYIHTFISCCQHLGGECIP